MSKIIWLKYDESKNKLKEVMPISNCFGFYDSGIGGLSIVERLAKDFPNKTFMFLKDSDNFPYGCKTKKELLNIGTKCLNKLIKFNPLFICIACNTMSCALNDYSFTTKTIKINEQIVKQVKRTLPFGKKLFIICTQATKDSNYFQNTLKEYVIEIKAIPEVVTMIEQNSIDKEYIKNIFLLSNFDYDGVILGCTHFNYLYDIIREVIRKDVYIFDGLDLLKEYIANY